MVVVELEPDVDAELFGYRLPGLWVNVGILGFAIAYIIPGNTIRPDGEGPPYNPLNVLYNLADLVNKGAFGLAIWSAAISNTGNDALLG